MIAIASDHGGYDLKERVKKYLEENNIPFRDFGCDSKASCDYPVFGHAAAKAVADGTCEKGIVICTTGIGISISANKVKGIRCALCSEPLSAKMTRLHNDANMLAMGAGIVGEPGSSARSPGNVGHRGWAASAARSLSQSPCR